MLQMPQQDDKCCRQIETVLLIRLFDDDALLALSLVQSLKLINLNMARFMLATELVKDAETTT